MKPIYSLALACLVLTSSGCATTKLDGDESTYSGVARVAVTKQVSSASNYIRGLFTKPLPSWQPAVETPPSSRPAAVASPAPAEQRDPSDAVQTHPVDLGGR
jgi:hypothetical protein